MSSAAPQLEQGAQALCAYVARREHRLSRAAGIPVSSLVAAIALSFCATAMLMAHAGLTVRLQPGLVGFLILYAAVVGAIMWLPHVAWSPSAQACSDGAEYATLLAGICVIGALASYPIAESSRGFFDVQMQDFDRAIRFDWLSCYELVAHHPVLQFFERAAYENIFVIPGVILAYLAATGCRSEATRFITSFWLTAILTLAAFYLFPTRGPLEFLLHGDAPYVPLSALYQAQIIPELRAHQLHDIDLEALHGLVGAPSFHAASAILFMAAAWPSRILRWPVVVASLAMLLATPVEGTHYLGDILAGLLIALVGLAAAAFIEKKCLMRGRGLSN